MGRNARVSVPCALLLLLALLCTGTAWAEDEGEDTEGIQLDSANEGGVGGAGVGIEYDEDYDPAVGRVCLSRISSAVFSRGRSRARE